MHTGNVSTLVSPEGMMRESASVTFATVCIYLCGVSLGPLRCILAAAGSLLSILATDALVTPDV